jgi:hypothetical protein
MIVAYATGGELSGMLSVAGHDLVSVLSAQWKT